MKEFLELKKSNCKNCYKCIRHCPVKSIRFSGNQAHIISEDCILCGQCFVVCPQNAKIVYNDTEKAKVLLHSGETVIASIAPSFTANYDGIGIRSMESALKKLGFAAAEETAIGATFVKKQYERMVSEGRQDVIVSSCCHTVNLMIQKYFPEALPHLARVVSPMQAHCMDIKKRYPNAKTIFIGPCISKKAEAENDDGMVDCVLTFEELSGWLKSEKIEFEAVPDTDPNNDPGLHPDMSKKGRARYFPTAGGILKSMDLNTGNYHYLSIDGLENCINAMKEIAEGTLSKCFIEMSACVGSCIGGPVMDKPRRSPVRDYLSVAKYAGTEDFDGVMPDGDLLVKNYMPIEMDKRIPDESEIVEILKQMGKTRKEDELNCGSCGYNSCREKAAAVFTGKADLSMCLPFLKDKAETFSDNIIKNTPNGILVLNEMLEVQQINAAALKIMNVRNASDVLGEQVIRILEPKIFLDVLHSSRQVIHERAYLAEYNRYIEETISYDRNYHILICIMRDVTTEETARGKKEKTNRQTIEITDKVVEKQMRIVQEIASLLGETAAETKIALTKLKESLNDE